MLWLALLADGAREPAIREGLEKMYPAATGDGLCWTSRFELHCERFRSVEFGVYPAVWLRRFESLDPVIACFVRRFLVCSCIESDGAGPESEAFVLRVVPSVYSPVPVRRTARE